MKTVIGLGNPGKEYENTRHNIGRDIALALAKHSDFDALEENKKYGGVFGKGAVGDDSASILLPDTFMNKSGKAVAALAPKAKNVIVIHDDTDIVLGSIKVSFGKNSGGHKGVESVMRALKTKDFWRIRVGVQKKKRVDAMDLVLKKFSPAEQLILKKIKKRIFELLEGDLETTTISVV